jgi:bis(5'-nucleosyl)-tetraphosphatase (symmetrical)
MVTQNFAIGDIQGCLKELKALLKAIQYDKHAHRLWLCGDLVNRGPDSLGVIEFIRDLPVEPRIVLGNHDLHLLAMASGVKDTRAKDNFYDVLDSPDCDDHCHWLRQQKLVHHDSNLGYTMVHAGIAPAWSIADAVQYSNEVERVLQGDDEGAHHYFEKMYGSKPSQWSEDLTGMKRLRLITNICTRMRYCYEDGSLDLKDKSPPGFQHEDLIPWFKVAKRKAKKDNILFGHWASLQGRANTKHVYALDTGCVWGGSLTAMRLEDEAFYAVPAH